MDQRRWKRDISAVAGLADGVAMTCLPIADQTRNTAAKDAVSVQPVTGVQEPSMNGCLTNNGEDGGMFEPPTP